MSNFVEPSISLPKHFELYEIFKACDELCISPVTTTISDTIYNIPKMWDAIRNFSFGNVSNVEKIELKINGNDVWTFNNDNRLDYIECDYWTGYDVLLIHDLVFSNILICFEPVSNSDPLNIVIKYEWVFPIDTNGFVHRIPQFGKIFQRQPNHNFVIYEGGTATRALIEPIDIDSANEIFNEYRNRELIIKSDAQITKETDRIRVSVYNHEIEAISKDELMKLTLNDYSPLQIQTNPQCKDFKIKKEDFSLFKQAIKEKYPNSTFSIRPIHQFCEEETKRVKEMELKSIKESVDVLLSRIESGHTASVREVENFNADPKVVECLGRRVNLAKFSILTSPVSVSLGNLDLKQMISEEMKQQTV